MPSAITVGSKLPKGPTVTGVLLLVTLMLTLYLNDDTPAPAEASRNQIRDQVERARQELADRLDRLRSQQLQASAMTNRVFLVPKTNPSGKEPVLVVLSATNGLWMRLGRTNVAEFPAASGSEGFASVLAACDPAHDQLMFYIRPSGVSHFQACWAQAKRAAFLIGYDPAEENQEYVLTPR